MYTRQQKAQEIDGRSHLPSVVFAIWVVSCAVFGPTFFVIRFGGFVDITIERIIFLFILIYVVVGLFKGKPDVQRNNTIEIAMGMFVLVCLISMTQTGFLPIHPEFYSPWFIFITGYLFPFFVFIFAKKYIVDERDVLVILHTLFYFGIYLCITAFLEFVDLKQFVFPRYIADPEVGIHWDRARGPFVNAPFNGVAILIGFISGLHLLQKKKGFSLYFYQAALLLYFPAVFFTLTRAIYLAMLVTVIIFLGWYKTSFPKWKLISFPLAVVMIVGIINSPRLLSTERREGGVYQVEEVSVRFALLERAAVMFFNSPLMGVGFAQFTPASTFKYRGRVPRAVETAVPSSHNHLLGIATELGIPGIVFYLAIIIPILWRLNQLVGKLPETGIMGDNLRIVIFSIWCVYLTQNLFAEPSNNLFVNAVPFLFAGLADGLYTRSLQPVLPSRSFVSKSPMRIINSHV